MHAMKCAIIIVYCFSDTTPVVAPVIEREAGATTSSSSRSETPASLRDSVTLEGVFDLCKDMSTLIRTMDARLRSVEDRSLRVTSAVKELNEYIKKYCKGTFTVKGSQYEVSASFQYSFQCSSLLLLCCC